MAVALGTKTIVSPSAIDGLVGSPVDSPTSTVPNTLAQAKHPARRKSASATAHTARQNALLPPTKAVSGKMAPAALSSGKQRIKSTAPQGKRAIASISAA